MTAPLVLGFGNRFVGPTQPVMVVAEISGNHEGDLARAIDLIRAAAASGADAVKFQCYTPGDLVGQDHVLTSGPWQGKRLMELYTQAQTPLDWFPTLFDEARANKLIPFASVFHERHLPLLRECGSAAYKIASPEITDLALIRACAATGKPIIISTGMASPEEITAAAAAAGHNAILLHCVSGYPTPVEELALLRMCELPSEVRGLSDHTEAAVAPIVAAASVALGAHLLERHLMLAGTHPLDEAFSSDPTDFAAYIAAVRLTEAALRDGPQPSQDSTRTLRRTLVFATAMRAGEELRADCFRTARNGQGLEVADMDDLLCGGAIVLRDVQPGDAVTWATISVI